MCACGFQIRVVASRIRAETPSARELAVLVGRVNAEVRGGLEDYERAVGGTPRRRSRDPHMRIVAASRGAGDRRDRMRAAAVELTREFEVFSLADWMKVAAGLGIEDPEAELEGLVLDRSVYEPRPGFYRSVEITS